MEHTTQSTTAERAADPQRELGLSHILTNLLPPTVHTADGPERYTVSAVFTRRPSAAEIDAIDGAEARAWLDRAQFPDIALAVSDRRLEIANTNLEELDAGLAAVVGQFLAELSRESDASERASAGELVRLDRSERERWARVRAAVEGIRFDGADTVPDPAERLGVTGIVASMLPPTLETDAAPERYTVPADFTRPPTHTELALIAGPLPRQRLAAAGYAAAGLTTYDGHLEIRDTNLGELGAGLAAVVAALLAEIGTEAGTDDARTATEKAELAEKERERARFVDDAAAAISFAASDAPASDPGHVPDPALHDEVEEWDEEGGAAGPLRSRTSSAAS